MRYGIRTLIATTAIAAIATSWLLRDYRERQIANTISRLRALDVVVEFLDNEGGYDVELIAFKDPNDVMNALALAVTLPRVRTFAATGAGFGDEAAGQVPGMTGLTGLGLGGTNVTDYGIECICSMESLTTLDLSATRVTDLSISSLNQLPNLSYLNLRHTRVTGGGFSTYEDKGHLHELVLADCGISSAGCRELARLHSLRKLSLNATHVTDEDLANLGRLTNLTDLDLGRTNVHGSGLKYLGGLVHLTRLILGKDSAWTDDPTSDCDFQVDLAKTAAISLHELPCFLQLKELGLRGTRLDPAGIERLAALPAIRILDLRGSNISDSDVEVLAKCPSLKEALVDDTPMTTTGKSRLRILLEHEGRDSR